MKKLLALVLALVMTMGLATVGTSAAFADAASIEHSEAVEVLNALGVVGGKENNNFDPTANVKRSEMAKMVTIAMLGDVDVSAFAGAPTDLTDINGHWAEGYIKYCYSQGIIGGRGNGKFDPDANVTATEAAKMLLVAIGYDASVQGYGGDQWKVNVARDAQLSGFYADLKGLTVDKALTRDETAQMVYNAMDADLIEKTPTISVTTGNISYQFNKNANHEDLLGNIFKAYTFEGTLDQFSYDSTKAKWTLTITNRNSTTQQVTSAGGAAGNILSIATNGNTTFGAYEDYTDLYKQKVKVLFVLDSKNAIDKAIGVYPTSANEVLVSHVVGKIDNPNATAKTLRVDGKDYSLTAEANATYIYEFTYNADTFAGTAVYMAKGEYTNNDTKATYLFKLIDNTGDGKGDVVVTYPQVVAKVESKSVSSTTIKAVVSSATTALQLKDIEAYDGLAKGDYVIYTAKENTATNKAKLEKATLESGTATATKSNDVQVNGTWFNQALLTNKIKAGNKINYIAYNGFIVYQEGATSTGAEIFALVLDVAENRNAQLGGTATAKLLLSDGSKPTVEVDQIHGEGTVSTTSYPEKNRLYAFEVDGDGHYDLYDATATYVGNDANTDVYLSVGYDGISYGYNTATYTYIYGGMTADTITVKHDSTGKNATITAGSDVYTIADDAVVFVYNGSNDATVTTGAQLKKVNDDTTKVLYMAWDNDASTGFPAVKLAYVSQAVSTKSTYAFALEDVSVVETSDGKYQASVKVWDGTAEATITSAKKSSQSDAAAILASVSKGVAFSYKLNASGLVAAASDIGTTGTVGTVGLAVTAYNGATIKASTTVFYKLSGTNTIVYSGTGDTYTYTIDSDTEIFYVNFGTSPVQGETSSTITTADKGTITGVTTDADGAYYANVKIIAGQSGKGQDVANLIVFDVNNDFNGIK